jgi:ABC-type glycerol-3-phosphate transport system substrate-binding protein
MFPEGPRGSFPGMTASAWAIPASVPSKPAAWEFIKWAASRDTMRTLLVEKGYDSVTRRSVIDGAEFRQRMRLNGTDVADLYLRTVARAGSGYMAYRAVHVYPQIGTQIAKAIESIVSEQVPARDALNAAQKGAIADLKRAGVAL